MNTGNKLLMAGVVGLGVWYFVKKTRASSLQPSESYSESPSLEQIFNPGGANATTTVDTTSSSSGSGGVYTPDSLGSGSGAPAAQVSASQTVVTPQGETYAELVQRQKEEKKEAATDVRAATDEQTKAAAQAALTELMRQQADEKARAQAALDAAKVAQAQAEEAWRAQATAQELERKRREDERARVEAENRQADKELSAAKAAQAREQERKRRAEQDAIALQEQRRREELEKAAAEWSRMEADATAKRIAEAQRQAAAEAAANAKTDSTGSSLPENFGAPKATDRVVTARKDFAPDYAKASSLFSQGSATSSLSPSSKKTDPPVVKVAVYKSPVTSSTRTVTASPKTVTAFTKAASVDQSGSPAKAATTVKAPAVALRASLQAMRGVYAIGADLTEAEFLAAAAKARLEASRREWAANQLAEQIAGLTYGRY